MKNFILLFFLILVIPFINAQETNPKVNLHEVSPLFNEETNLSIKLNYSKKDLLKFTNDSTYIKSNINYTEEDGGIKNMDVEMRARGNYRRTHCYYLPLWIKINQADSKGSIFEDDKKKLL